VVFFLSIFGVNREELAERARAVGREEMVLKERRLVKVSLIANVVQGLVVKAAMPGMAAPAVEAVPAAMAATS
jgi:hypothetical protein